MRLSNNPHNTGSADLFLIVFFCSFLCVGLLFFGIGLHALYLQSAFQQRNNHATGMVSNHYGAMQILVAYKTANGKETYALPANMYISRPAIGSQIHLSYNPAQPLEVVTHGGLPPSMLAGILALAVFGGIGAAGAWFAWRQRRLRHWLYTHGQGVEARLLRSRWAGWAHGNQRYRVYAEWVDPATNTPYTFSGFEYSTSDLRLLEERKVVLVLIDPDDPKRYYMVPAQDTVF